MQDKMVDYTRDKLNDYKERQRGWQDKSIEQLSFANNFLLTISTGFLAYVFDKTSETLSKLSFSLSHSRFDKLIATSSLSVFFLTLSVFTGVLVLISRLYDFRITRHIALVRQRFFENNIDKIGENKNAAFLSHREFDDPCLCDQIIAILSVIFCKIEFIPKSEMKTGKQQLEPRFNKIRELSFRLGTISWKWTKLQGLFFIIGIFIYMLFLITK